ncbi:MAG: hypothetical protein MJ051_00125 [Akkermansia sp.]|nr:hypothetical protein [Akkermansia sp.]
MARIRLDNFTKSSDCIKSVHKPVVSEYIISKNSILQINMFGSDERQDNNMRKTSQTLQIDKATAKRLVQLFQEAGLLDD